MKKERAEREREREREREGKEKRKKGWKKSLKQTKKFFKQREIDICEKNYMY